MNFKPGDRVRFLNTKGGGTVAKIINSFMVSVAIEDGFEIPTLTSELVIIEPSGVNDKMFTRKDEIQTPSVVAQEEIIPDESDRISKIHVTGLQNTFPSGVYLAFTPQNQQWIMTGKLDIYLINNTNYDILYSFFLKDENNRFSGIDYGSVPQGSKLILESIVREDINQWSSGIIQVLLHPDESDRILMPVSTTYRIKGSAFFNDHSYKECSMLSEKKALLYTICELNRLPSTFEHVLQEKEGKENLPETARQFKVEAIIDKHNIAHREAEVDLHISALREKYNNLSPREILTIQIGTFERMLESALANNYSRIVFIHGVGNGTLKQALVDKVKDYGDIEFKNASYAKYGNGAIEIILHQNM
ncbi:MAG: DUF2027 domain-containing protein [Bacteroidales bacterium]|nr:DUF2027 domain-containing protein [Bacteroidales bacterium]